VIDPRDAKHLYLATMWQGILVSKDTCKSWNPTNDGISNPYIHTLAMDPKNPDTLYAGSANGAYMSKDGGKTWGEINNGLLGELIIYSMAVNPQDGTLFANTPYGIFSLTNN